MMGRDARLVAHSAQTRSRKQRSRGARSRMQIFATRSARRLRCFIYAVTL